MKIEIIGSAHPFRGGLSAYNERLARAFIEEGHSVVIRTFTLQYPKFLFPGKTQYSDEPAPDNLKIVRCINSINPFNWIKVGRRIRKQKPDLVIVKYWLPFMGPAFGTILRRIKKNKTTRVICIVDNIIPHESRPGDRAFTKYFVKPVDAFIAMSENVYKDLDQFTSKPKSLSPHPLFDNFGEIEPREVALKKLDLDPNFRYLLFFGLIRDYKGLDILLKAMSHEKLKALNIRLIVAGEYYASREPYDKIIAENNLDPKLIQVSKFITDSEVSLYFNASDVIVQPYKSATQSGVTQIAYHFNKPMIVTNVGGLPELCPHEKVGYICDVDDQAISDAIHRFFNETDINTMVENIKIEKAKYSWDILVSNILKLAQ